jgi:hypothetical protein
MACSLMGSRSDQSPPAPAQPRRAWTQHGFSLTSLCEEDRPPRRASSTSPRPGTPSSVPGTGLGESAGQLQWTGSESSPVAVVPLRPRTGAVQYPWLIRAFICSVQRSSPGAPVPSLFVLRAGATCLGWFPSSGVLPVMRRAAVAASGECTGPDGARAPTGLVHAWRQGTRQTLCGVLLSRSGLLRFPHVDWADVQPVAGRDADLMRRLCPRCVAAMRRRSDKRRWHRAGRRGQSVRNA